MYTRPTQTSSISRETSGLSSWDTVAFACVAFAVLFGRLLHPERLLGYYQDDFFYYLKVAQNVAAHGQSTFNGLNLTNGYHPLWMLVLVVLCLLTHGTAFFVALQFVSLLACLVTYVCLRQVFTVVAPGIAATAAAFALGMASLQLMRYGMEVTLTLPLNAVFLYMLLRRGAPKTFRAACALGILSSLVILSRLDAGLLIAAVCLALMPRMFRQGNFTAVLCGFIAGVLPLLLLYFTVQWHVFHLLTPVSGLAKQLKTGHGLSSATWLSLLPWDRMKEIVVLPQLLLLLLGLAVLPASRSREYNGIDVRNVAIALMVFPILHWTILSALSDWQMWAWYYYSLTLGCAGAVLLLAGGSMRRVLPWFSIAFSGLLLVYSAAYVWQGPNSIAVLNSSRGLAEYMDAHPGVWMIGDQAGTTAYLSRQPIIQMEGLVMDKDFLERMRANTPLPDMVRHYHGNYYAFFGSPSADGCFYIAEPSHAGPTSPKMLGKACTKAIATFSRGDSQIQVIPADALQVWKPAKTSR